MAVSQPTASDNLNSPSHSALHRIIAADVAGTVKTIQAQTSNLVLSAPADGTSSIQFNKNDLTTTIMSIDTTNSRVGIGTTSPNSGLEMGNDNLIAEDVNAGLTAGTTQTQAGGLDLIAQVNEVSTVANTSDTVVLPSLPATGSLRITIINKGANTMRVFPASGDDLGAGANTADATNIPTATMRVYQSYDATNWFKYISE